MGELEDERALGVRAHTRQVDDVRAQQRPTHNGSGGKAAWKDKFMSARYFISIVLIYFTRKTILGILVKIPHYGNLQIDQIHVIWEFPT